MAKKKKGETVLEDGTVVEEKGGKLSSILIGIIIVIVWLAILCALIKFDVGGFGSSVMYPIFKDVPVINKILPDVSETDEEDSDKYPYKSLADAIKYIKELEVEIQDDKDKIAEYEETIADLRAEIERLKQFENEQEEFNRLKEQFYNEVVFGDNALDYEYYKQYYESIDPEYAEKLYKQVVAEYLKDTRYQELADAYAAMKPKKAAAALYEMTGDLDKVVSILQCMEVEPRAAILNALSDIDAVFCGKITVLLSP
ncbi:MAG: hypothetical protein K1W00_11185 [Lachnospiraceae bacterium]